MKKSPKLKLFLIFLLIFFGEQKKTPAVRRFYVIKSETSFAYFFAAGVLE